LRGLDSRRPIFSPRSRSVSAVSFGGTHRCLYLPVRSLGTDRAHCFPNVVHRRLGRLHLAHTVGERLSESSIPHVSTISTRRRRWRVPRRGVRAAARPMSRADPNTDEIRRPFARHPLSDREGVASDVAHFGRCMSAVSRIRAGAEQGRPCSSVPEIGGDGRASRSGRPSVGFEFERTCLISSGSAELIDASSAALERRSSLETVIRR